MVSFSLEGVHPSLSAAHVKLPITTALSKQRTSEQSRVVDTREWEPGGGRGPLTNGDEHRVCWKREEDDIDSRSVFYSRERGDFSSWTSQSLPRHSNACFITAYVIRRGDQHETRWERRRRYHLLLEVLGPTMLTVMVRDELTLGDVPPSQLFQPTPSFSMSANR